MGLESTGSNPVFPNLLQFINPYTYVLNHFNFAIIKNNFFFTLLLTPRAFLLVKFLHSINLIRRFYKTSSGKYIIFPNYSKIGKIIKGLKIYYRKRNPIILRLQALKLLKFSTKSSLFILETSRGIMDHNQAMRRNLGGTLITILY